MINKAEITFIMPECRYPEDWVRPLSQAMEKFEINNPMRKAAFLGQVAHESGQLNKVQESLNYSPRRVMEVWPSRFKDFEEATKYARNPEKLANRVYADRLGNGPESSGDGFLYRGRGLIQVTGRANYVRVSKMLDMPAIVSMPDYLTVPRYAAESAAAFWQDKGLNALADKLSTTPQDKVVKAITKKVSGGKLGLEERLAFTTSALEVLDTEFAA